MRIGNGSLGVRGYTPTPAPTRTSSSTGSPPSRDVLRQQLTRIDDEIGDLRNSLKSLRARGLQKVPTLVGVRLDLDGGQRPGTSAVLSSRAEVNAEPTQLSTRKPLWTGPGGRAVTVQGVYTGAVDTAFSLEVRDDKGRVRILDGQGKRIDEVKLEDPTVRTTVVVGDGLSIVFEPGAQLTKNDTLRVETIASTDGAIDVGDPFDGRGPATPRFEEGRAVTAGSFTVNGVTITVGASDTVAAVLERITASAAGVVASYDGQTERVSLTTKAAGADQEVVLGGDTSGLLRALKLDGLAPARGTDPRPASMSEIAALQGVKAGTITVGGVDIAIDPSTQSIQDVVDAIDAVEGVTAKLWRGGQLLIQGTRGEELVLSDGGTDFFATTGIATGAHRGREGQRRISDVAARKIAAEVGQLRDALDDVIDNEGLVGLTAELRTKLGAAVETGLRDHEDLETLVELVGLDGFKVDDVAGTTAQVKELRTRYDALRRAMLGQQGRGEGLLEQLQDVVREGLRQVADLDVRV